jgi:hypothetical protein
LRLDWVTSDTTTNNANPISVRERERERERKIEKMQRLQEKGKGKGCLPKVISGEKEGKTQNYVLYYHVLSICCKEIQQRGIEWIVMMNVRRNNQLSHTHTHTG